VLRAALATRMPYARATRIASGVGQGMALLLGIAGLAGSQFTLMLIALFVFVAAGEERAMVETRTSLVGLPVRAAMLTEFFRLQASDPLQRAVDYLMAGSQQDFPVLEGEAPVGVLTRGELIRGLQRGGAATPVGDVIHRDAQSVDANDSLEQVIVRMRTGRHSTLPVLSQGRIVGLLTLENVSELLLVRDALRRWSASA
jgi:predicted transcriptional regulator